MGGDKERETQLTAALGVVEAGTSQTHRGSFTLIDQVEASLPCWTEHRLACNIFRILDVIFMSFREPLCSKTWLKLH